MGTGCDEKLPKVLTIFYTLMFIKANPQQVGVYLYMKEVLSVKEASALLQVGKNTLYRYVKMGVIPAFRIGKILRFHKESLEKWMEERGAENISIKKEQS